MTPPALESLRDWVIRIVIATGLLATTPLLAQERNPPERLLVDIQANVIAAADASSLEGLRTAWALGPKRRFTVVHLGDSHVHAGHATAALRKILSHTRGHAGIGLVFPYAVAKTYAPTGYTTEFQGRWQAASTFRIPPKLPLGVLGIGARTENPGASFTLTFTPPPSKDWREVKIFCTRSRTNSDVWVETAGHKTRIRLDGEGPQPCARVRLKAVGPTLTLRTAKRRAHQASFELHGISVESTRQGGALVHTAGLGGSRFRALLHQEHLSTELSVLAPDVVIVEWGTNDVLYDDVVKPELEMEIREGLRRIRAGAPRATIVLVTPQDLWYRGTNLKATASLAALLHRVAAADGYTVWDWYRISRGAGQLPKWQEAGLANRDLIHLTSAGYRSKGELLAQALLHAALGPVQSDQKDEQLVR